MFRGAPSFGQVCLNMLDPLKRVTFLLVSLETSLRVYPVLVGFKGKPTHQHSVLVAGWGGFQRNTRVYPKSGLVPRRRTTHLENPRPRSGGGGLPPHRPSLHGSPERRESERETEVNVSRSPHVGTGVLFSLVRLEFDGAGLNELCSICQGHLLSKRSSMVMAVRRPV